MRVTPAPVFWYAVFSFLDGTQYAKGRYAVRKNPVVSYADNKFYSKKVQFSSRNTINEVKKPVFRHVRHFIIIYPGIRLTMNLGNETLKNIKKTFTRMIVPVRATDCIFIFFM